MNIRFRTAYAAVLTVGVLGTVAACGAAQAHTGDIRPSGTYHGIRLCAYDLDDDGIEISHHQKVPCVVTDARSKKDRKKAKAPAPAVVMPGSKTKTTTAAKKPSAPKTVKTAPAKSTKLTKKP
jgi:hypothetical protein